MQRYHVSQGDNDDEESQLLLLTFLRSSCLQRQDRDDDSQLIFLASLQSSRLQPCGVNIRDLPVSSTLFDAGNNDPDLSSLGQRHSRSTDSVSVMSGSVPSTYVSF